MKFVTIDCGEKGHPGLLMGDGNILDLILLRRHLGVAKLIPADVRGILEGGAQALALVDQCRRAVEEMSDHASAQLSETGALVSFQGTPLLAPIPEPRLLLAASGNYGRHLREYPDVPLPENPTAFIKPSDTLTGHEKPILIPPQFPDQVDFEGEFAIVFGRTCHNVDEVSAMQYVAGYTIVNDVSARNWVAEVFSSTERFQSIRAWDRNILGKNLPSFSPCGPILTTADEITDPHDLAITTRVNGKVMQDSCTSDLISRIPRLISYFSKWYRFQPGDIFTTGTPEGVGAGRTPPVYLKQGDRIEIEIAGLGTLANPVA